MKEIILNHPMVTHKLSVLRDKNTSTKEFREIISELAILLCYEATKDIKQLAKFENSQITIENIEALDEITNLIFPVAYVMTKEADATQITDYEGFLKSIDDIYSDGVDWISSVILFACSPISGQLQNIKTTAK